ncbi:MAG: hypothetical protein M3Y21_12510, partial [Candidatus Eremiobacteraeota bacterium]|nr:hypothetical protein [Candidatus Eremiobacteraeota bacterium]
VNPTSGQMQRVAARDFSSLPTWVKRVVPAQLAIDYNQWFGEFVHGWWNARLSQRDVHIPARTEVFGLLAADRFVWFVDHTSPSLSDQSMTGFTYMDTVSGAMTYYTASGGEFSSQGAERAVASNPIVRQGRLLPTQPILYRLSGRNTWIVPLVADSGKYQSLALVDARNGRVIIGNVSAASPAQDALVQYQTLQGSAIGGPSAAPRIRGVLDRVAGEGGAVVFTLKGDRRIYAIAHPDPAAALTRAGDSVMFVAVRDQSGEWTATNFIDQTLHR